MSSDTRWWEIGPPIIVVTLQQLTEGIPLADFLLDCGLCSSKRDIERQFKQNSIKLNGTVCKELDWVLSPFDLRQIQSDDRVFVISVSKGKHDKRMIVVERKTSRYRRLMEKIPFANVGTS